jgi:ketosteroid isomerase-like protein
MTEDSHRHRLLAIVTDALDSTEPIDEIRHAGNGEGAEVRVIVPAVEANSFQHTLGDIDEPKRQAEERLRAALDSLSRNGVAATGGVGDPDPVQAAQDALHEAPADEVLIFERESEQARWFEEGLFDRARESLEPPLRMVVVHTGDADGEHVVGVEEAGAGTVDADGSELDIPISHNMPQVPRRDLAGMVIGILGTIVAIVLAAAAASNSGSEAGWHAVAILVAIGIALANMAHVVGLTLFESVRYHGGFAKFFRALSLVGTPAAVLINLAILIFA